MLVSYIREKGQKPTTEQLEMIEAAAKREIQFDEDCPELSDDMLKQLQCVARQRDRWKQQFADKCR